MKQRTGYLMLRTPGGGWLGEKEGKKKRGIWYAVWTVAGKKFVKTTGKPDHRDAETELRRIMEPFSAGDEVTTLQNIAAKLESHKTAIARYEDERNPPLKVSQAWAAYRKAANRPDSGPSTLELYEMQFTVFEKWLEKEHPEAVYMRDVSPAIAAHFAAHLNETKRSASTFNQYIRLLQLVFRVLKNPARMADNPWTKDTITRKTKEKTYRRALTMDELKKVCAAASGEMRPLFALGIYTGLRLGDCATLRWAEVDLRRGLILRVPNKIARRDSEPVSIPIHPVLSAILNETPARERGEYVLPSICEKYKVRNDAVTDMVKAHFKACGIKVHKSGTGDGTGKRAVVEVGFHSLRHTFVSLCAGSNAPLSVVQSLVGHSNPEMTQHYTHVSELAAASAVNALPYVMGESAPALLPAAKMIDAATVRALAEKLNAKTWKATREELLNLA